MPMRTRVRFPASELTKYLKVVETAGDWSLCPPIRRGVGFLRWMVGGLGWDGLVGLVFRMEAPLYVVG